MVLCGFHADSIVVFYSRCFLGRFDSGVRSIVLVLLRFSSWIFYAGWPVVCRLMVTFFVRKLPILGLAVSCTVQVPLVVLESLLIVYLHRKK